MAKAIEHKKTPLEASLHCETEFFDQDRNITPLLHEDFSAAKVYTCTTVKRNMPKKYPLYTFEQLSMPVVIEGLDNDSG